MDRIEHKIGTTFAATIGLPGFDLTGCTITSSIRKSDQHHPLTVSVRNPGPADAKIDLAATSGQTAGWGPGEYAWDVLIAKPNGDRISLPATHNLLITVIRGATQ